MPEDAQQAIGHGVRAKRSKSGAISLIFWGRRIAVQRSSPSIGSLAAALAKAQPELINPEKSMVATIRADGRGAVERYLSLRTVVERPRHRAQDLGPA